MSKRIHINLLSAVLLALLTACGTTPSGPAVVHPVEEAQTTEAEAVDSQPEDLFQRDPSERSLDEVAALTKSLPPYQPDLALEILRSLESVPSGRLMAMIESQALDPEFTEWLELTLQARSLATSNRSITAAAATWSDYHYGHVIGQLEFTDLVRRYKALFPAPARVAVLLPEEGGLAPAARAIRDGILSAYLEQPGNTSIRFYSSGKNAESAIAAYRQAREDGATQVIGPLRLAATRALSALGDLSVPVLLLNEPADELAANPGQENLIDELADDLRAAPEQGSAPLEQVNAAQERNSAVTSLTLSQTEEAAMVARRALEQGQKNALMIVANTAWGTRMESTFATAFEEGDGRILATTHFSPATSDHSRMLTQLLKIDESKQRKTDLQSWLGVGLTFEPSRRDDFDFIFLAAQPSKGREIKPLLRFHDTGDVPVYAMGRIYSGKVAQANDQDLDGVVFPTTPWQLNLTENDSNLPDSVRDGSFGNLYALGRDAWSLLPWLPLLQKDPDLKFEGNTGTLLLQPDGRFLRQPAWAQFSGGQLVPYQWPPGP